MKLRDNILYEQKLVLDKNQIENDITYDGLKAVDKVESNMKLPADDSLPSINMNRASNNGGNRYNKAYQERSIFTRRDSSSSMSNKRLPNIGGGGGGGGGRQPQSYAGARNRCIRV